MQKRSIPRWHKHLDHRWGRPRAEPVSGAMSTRSLELCLASLAFLPLFLACNDSTALPFASSPPGAIHKIQHVVIILQENRSFDSYFGTFPGADGIPMQNGVPAVCVPDPELGGCV